MASFTVSIPDGLKRKLDEHPEVNWPEYLKKRFEVRLNHLNKFEDLVTRGGI